eukprot:17584-Heterococcus_DN1.PRE.3
MAAMMETASTKSDSENSTGEEAAPAPARPALPPGTIRKKPIVCIVLGMAGSGKTTLLQRLHLHMNATSKNSYYINLDPAVTQVPFGANIDIRDTVNYREVMAQYGLGPNGGIMTSLNLFATRFDQVLGLLEARSDSMDDLEYVFVDTPASGQIITESLSSTFPTCLAYVVDTPRTTNPTTFMSNMLYACSILYRTRLPMVIAFNKSDVTPPDFAAGDFQEALDATADDSYMSSLNRSLSLVLDEFYSTLTNGDIYIERGSSSSRSCVAIYDALAGECDCLHTRHEHTCSVLLHVGISAATGDGIPEFFKVPYNMFESAVVNMQSYTFAECTRCTRADSADMAYTTKLVQSLHDAAPIVATDRKLHALKYLALTCALDAAAVEFERDYLPDLQERIAATEKQKQAARDREMAKLMKDVSLTRQDKIVAGSGSAPDNDTTAADTSDKRAESNMILYCLQACEHVLLMCSDSSNSGNSKTA